MHVLSDLIIPLLRVSFDETNIYMQVCLWLLFVIAKILYLKQLEFPIVGKWLNKYYIVLYSHSVYILIDV